MMNSDIIDTDPLREITGGSEQRMKRYIGIFLQGMPGYLEQIEKATMERDVSAMYAVLHSIKPHIKMMGMVKLIPDIDEREKLFTETISDEDFLNESKVLTGLLREASDELTKYVQDND
mgnify:CR=1 FL=1